MSKVVYSKERQQKKNSDTGFKLCAVFCALSFLVVTYYVGYVNLGKKMTDTGLRIARLDNEINEMRRSRDLTKSELEQVRSVSYVEKKLAENDIHLRKTRKDHTVILSKPAGIDRMNEETAPLAGKPQEGRTAIR